MHIRNVLAALTEVIVQLNQIVGFRLFSNTIIIRLQFLSNAYTLQKSEHTLYIARTILNILEIIQFSSSLAYICTKSNKFFNLKMLFSYYKINLKVYLIRILI